MDGIRIDMHSDRKCDCGNFMTLKYGKYGFYLKCETCGKTKGVKPDTPAIVLDNKILFNLKGENDEGSSSDGRAL